MKEKTDKTVQKGEMVGRCCSCKKCSSVCPANINILAELELYVRYQAEGHQAVEILSENEFFGRPEDCIECGACSAYCPKGIDVKSIIRKLAMQQCSICDFTI